MFLSKRLNLILFMLAIFVVTPLSAADLPLFRFNGFDYSKAELPASLRNQVYELEKEHYEKLQQIIDSAVLEIYLQEEAERTDKSPVELRKTLLGVTEPDEATLKQFYEDNKERIQAPYDQIRDRLKQFVMQQQFQQQQGILLATVKQQYPLEILMPEPAPPSIEIASEGYPSKGSADAKVTIVEFADYQCPHCKNASLVVKKVMEEYGDKVKLVFMDLPIISKRGLDSTLLAEAAACADQQGKFWDYHDLLFQRQTELRSERINEFAEQLELDQDAFKSCLESDETKTKVANSKQEAARLGVTSTPSFFVNGTKVITDDIYVGLTEAIESALKSDGS